MEPRDEYRERILDAALGLYRTHGLRRVSVEDVARAAGVNRATIYRRFDGKQALVEAVLIRDARRFFEGLAADTADIADANERLVEGFVIGIRQAREDPLLTRLLQTEPETILPVLTVDGGPVLAAVSALLAGELLHSQDGMLPDAHEVAEMLVRIALSFVLTPESRVPTGTDEETRRLARRYLLPVAALS